MPPEHTANEIWDYHVEYAYQLVDGSYTARSHKLPGSSVAFFSLPLAQWAECISVAERNGMRFWGDSRNVDANATLTTNSSMDCFNVGGYDFRDNGSWDRLTTPVVSALSSTDFVVTGSGTVKPSIINPESGLSSSQSAGEFLFLAC